MRKLLFLLLILLPQQLAAQVIPAGFPVLEELIRRKQLLGQSKSDYSFVLRPILDEIGVPGDSSDLSLTAKEKDGFALLPLISTNRFTSRRPYGWSDYGMIPNPGFQTYFSGGGHLSYKGINLTFSPELVFAQNLGYETDLSNMSEYQVFSRYYLWNVSDTPERFGEGNYFRSWWGQSKLTFQYGAFELGASSRNIWWGPGQWNSLTFSNNSQGFLHLTLNSVRPAKTFLGNFEGQLIVGKLENSGFGASQDQAINQQNFLPFTGDWRYLNAVMVSWNPKWVNGLYLGFSRTNHQYNSMRGKMFMDWFPIFEGFQKKKFFKNGNTLDYDANGRSQTFTVFGRWMLQKTKSEIYFEFGRRDHAYDWRDFMLNPEHARAYILGYNQLIKVPGWRNLLQIRSEITHQQESVNRYIRNEGITGGYSWHTHGTARGFTNLGQPLGVGIGMGSNVQTLEFALVNGTNKTGFVLERLANNEDFYYKALMQFSERQPWIDYSMGFLFDRQLDKLLLSSKIQLIHARNYQWKMDPLSTKDFPRGMHLTSFLGQVSAVYFWNR